MKNWKLYSVISILTVFVFLGCPPPDGGKNGDGEGTSGPPSAIAEFSRFLSSKPDNTKDEPNLLVCPRGKSGAFTIPSGITIIGWNGRGYGLDNCNKLTSVTIPNSVTSIRDYTFSNCTNLTSVIFQNFNINISDNAFGSPSEAYIGDLRAKYLAGGPGTYIRQHGNEVWTKQ